MDTFSESHARLEAIAKTLGVPVDVFSGSSTLSEPLASLSELLHLWCRIETQTDRRKVLDFIRAIVDTAQEDRDKQQK